MSSPVAGFRTKSLGSFVFLAPGAAANPVREGLKVRQISCKPGAYVTACVDGMAVYICNAESGI